MEGREALRSPLVQPTLRARQRVLWRLHEVLMVFAHAGCSEVVDKK